MRILPLLVLATLGATPAVAAARDYPARDFDRVELKSVAQVTIRQAPRFAVHAEGDPRLVEELTAEARGGTLVLGWRDPDVRSNGEGQLRVTVDMPHIVAVGVSGVGTIAIDRVEGPAFAAEVGGAGTVRVAALQSSSARLVMGGAGQIEVAGRTGFVDADVSGVGSIEAFGLSARGGRIGVSGAGHVRTRVDGPVDVSLSGLGDVEVAGRARCTVHKSGLGSVRCG